LQAVLNHHGITVDIVVTSEDARAYKPRPEPFRLALQRLGLAATDVIHIGDYMAYIRETFAVLKLEQQRLLRTKDRS